MGCSDEKTLRRILGFLGGILETICGAINRLDGTGSQDGSGGCAVVRTRAGKWAAFDRIPGTIVPKPRKVRKAPKDKTPEAAIQEQAEAYLDALGLFYIRLPDAKPQVAASSKVS